MIFSKSINHSATKNQANAPSRFSGSKDSEFSEIALCRVWGQRAFRIFSNKKQHRCSMKDRKQLQTFLKTWNHARRIDGISSKFLLMQFRWSFFFEMCNSMLQYVALHRGKSSGRTPARLRSTRRRCCPASCYRCIPNLARALLKTVQHFQWTVSARAPRSVAQEVGENATAFR